MKNKSFQKLIYEYCDFSTFLLKLNQILKLKFEEKIIFRLIVSFSKVY